MRDPPGPGAAIDLGSLLSMDPGQGRITLGRERMLLVSADAFGALRRELHDTLGPALAAEVLFRFGQRCGREEAGRVVREMRVESPEKALALGPLLHAFEGVTAVRAGPVEVDPETGAFHMAGTWENSYEAEQHLRLFGPSPEPVCRTLTGYASGYASVVVGRDLLCREATCRGRGDATCSWSIAAAPARSAEVLPEGLRTAYQELESRIRGQEALFRSLSEVSDALGQVVYTVDESGTVTSWNRTAAGTFGWGADEILGRHERVLFPADRVAAGEPEELAARCRSGRVADALRRRLRKDGSEVTVRGGRSPVRGPDGRVIGATVVLHPLPVAGADPAERTLRTLLDNVPEGIALASHDQRILECNRGFREILGLPEGPVQGLSCYSLLAGLGSPCTDCNAHLIFEEGLPARCRPSFTRPDGRRAYFDLRSFPLRNAAGEVTHELKYLRDVTPEVERDKELEDKRRLAALGEMAARVAHEVKNPLAGMRGALQNMASRRPEGDRDREVLGEVVAHIDRIDRTVRDLLSFSRPSHIRREATRPDDVVEAVASFLRGTPDVEGIELAVERGGLPEVPLDRQLLMQVLVNLVQNAAQALRPQDDRTIRMATAAAPGGREVEITVSDGGPGIPPALRGRVFAPFFTTKARGTGLGLSISRRIVEAHGGTLEFECPPDGGTRFRVRLPL